MNIDKNENTCACHCRPVNPGCVTCGGTGLVPADEVLLVDIRHRSTRESWVTCYRDGVIVYHSENDGPRFLRRGPEEYERKITRDELYATVGPDGRRRVDQFYKEK